MITLGKRHVLLCGSPPMPYVINESLLVKHGALERAVAHYDFYFNGEKYTFIAEADELLVYALCTR